MKEKKNPYLIDVADTEQSHASCEACLSEAAQQRGSWTLILNLFPRMEQLTV